MMTCVCAGKLGGILSATTSIMLKWDKYSIAFKKNAGSHVNVTWTLTGNTYIRHLSIVRTESYFKSQYVISDLMSRDYGVKWTRTFTLKLYKVTINTPRFRFLQGLPFTQKERGIGPSQLQLAALLQIFSNLDRVTASQKWEFSWYSSVFPGECRDITFK
jgi:hypothetical protein